MAGALASRARAVRLHQVVTVHGLRGVEVTTIGTDHHHGALANRARVDHHQVVAGIMYGMVDGDSLVGGDIVTERVESLVVAAEVDGAATADGMLESLERVDRHRLGGMGRGGEDKHGLAGVDGEARAQRARVRRARVQRRVDIGCG